MSDEGKLKRIEQLEESLFAAKRGLANMWKQNAILHGQLADKVSTIKTLRREALDRIRRMGEEDRQL